jgi:DNA-binding MarR family transcriptional regulator
VDEKDAPSLVGSMTFLLVAAGRTAQRRLDEELAEHGLSLRHIGALGHLVNRPDLSYSDLARRAGITSQSMHATVRRLEELDAVRREYPGQGHRARLEVTERGRELLASAGAIAARIDEELIENLAAEDRDRLRRVLFGVAMPQGLGSPPKS